MRMDQWIGLTQEAQDYLEKHCRVVPNIVCPDCGCVITESKDCKAYEEVEGMFGTPAGALHEYKLKHGPVAKEIVQGAPWSSGPCFFVCLEIEGERCFEWSEKEIDDA